MDSGLAQEEDLKAALTEAAKLLDLGKAAPGPCSVYVFTPEGFIQHGWNIPGF